MEEIGWIEIGQHEMISAFVRAYDLGGTVYEGEDSYPSLTNLTVIERSVKGKGFGFDFWLGSIDDINTLFQRKARLEVSGIRKGSETLIQSRVNMKLRQMSPSDTVAPGYIAVVEFGIPQARIVEKCRA